MTHKEKLRQHCKERRQALSNKTKAAYSKAIQQTLIAYLMREYTDQVHILCYQALHSEVDTRALFQQGSKDHHYYAPVTQKNGDMHWLKTNQQSTWQQGYFNIQEPRSGLLWQGKVHSPSILLCPIVGFDIQGNRIGMGKGCFDRWLETQQQYFDIIIGLAFSCQNCQHIPHEPHDIPLHAIITEQGWISCLNT